MSSSLTIIGSNSPIFLDSARTYYYFTDLSDIDYSAEVNIWWEQSWVAIANHISDIIPCTSVVEADNSLVALALRKHVPEAKGFVASASNNRGTIWAHCKVENSEGMAGQSTYFLHWGILPNYYLVQRVPMCAHYLISSPGEH